MDETVLQLHDLKDIARAYEECKADLNYNGWPYTPAKLAKMAMRIHEIVERAKERQHKKVAA